MTRARFSVGDLCFEAQWTLRGLRTLKIQEGVGTWPAHPLPLRTRQLRAVLHRVLSGKPPREKIPIDWNGATHFQKKVWRALQRIPWGQTRSYGEIARAIGKPRAARAVGAACGANPLLLLVPCHRVVAGSGSLGGFSAGLALKKQLLALESGARDRAPSLP